MPGNEHIDPTSSDAYRNVHPGAETATGSPLVGHLWQMLYNLAVRDGQMLVSGAHPAMFADILDPGAPQVGEYLTQIPPQQPYTGPHSDQRPGPTPERYGLVIYNFPQTDTRSRTPRTVKALVDLQGHSLMTALDRTKPGGFTVAITSHQFLDAPDAKHRHQIHAHADLLGAVRLPSTLLPHPRPFTDAVAPPPESAPAFGPEIGPGAAVDLLVLRRRPDGVPNQSMPFLFISPVMIDDTPAAINEYYDEVPEHVLGDPHRSPDHPGGTLTLTPEPDIDQGLHDALSAIVRRGTTRGLTATPSPANQSKQDSPPRVTLPRRSPAVPRPTTQVRPDARPSQRDLPTQEPPSGLGR
jgi:hypothetical protein